MARALLFQDDQALAAYLGGAALVLPELADSPCLELELAPSNGEPTRALYFAQDLELPTPTAAAHGTRLHPARLDKKRRTLTLEDGQAEAKRTVKAAPAGDPRQLAEAVRPVPWQQTPAEPELIYVCQPGQPFAELVSEHLELGRDQLSWAAVQGPELGERILLDVREPAWFVLERWIPRREPEVRAYRRLSGTTGPRRVYLEWGYEHPLEAFLRDPAREELVVLIDRDGQQRTCELGQFQDVGQALDLEAGVGEAEALLPAAEPERVAVSLRLEGRPTPQDPELWLLPAERRDRLEALLAQTPEDELRNLLVACVEKPGQGGAPGQRLFAVREVLAGRARPRLLPLGELAYAPVAGLTNLLLPCDRSLAPPLSNDRYARAFSLQPGVLVVVQPAASSGEGPGGQLQVLRVEERAFQPVAAIVDFVVDAEVAQVQKLIQAAPFDLGRFAEEDLIPARLKGQKAPAEPPPPPPAPEREAKEDKPQKERGLLKRIRNLFGAPEPEADRPQPAPVSRDAEAEALARLEEALVLEEPTVERWWELASRLYQAEQAEEALRAAENALWEIPPGAEGVDQALAELSQRISGASSQGLDTPTLYGQVFGHREALAQGGGAEQADRIRAATEAIYAQLHEHEGRLRKKSRWLLWSMVLRESGDAIEEEHQREEVLSGLVLRGLEDREVPPFVRRVLLDHYGLKAATGSGAAEVRTFLESAREFAMSLSHPAFRSEALAHTAWALTRLGEPKRAEEVAKEAQKQAGERSRPDHVAFKARALARVGAVFERTKGRDQGKKLLDQAVSRLDQLLASSDPKTQEAADGQKALGAWFVALSDARAATSGRGAEDPLLMKGLEALSARAADKQLYILHHELEEPASNAAAAIKSLGGAAWLRDQLRRLLSTSRLTLPNVEDAIAVLEHLSEGDTIAAEDAQLAFTTLLEHAPEIDEFTVDMLLTALRAEKGDPWERIEELERRLRGLDLFYGARLVRLAGLRRLAELGERRRGAELLATAIADAWTHETPAGGGGSKTDPVGTERMRLIVRLALLVPAFGMRQRGLELLGEIKDRAKAEPSAFLRNELLTAAAMAASQLGDSRASLELVEEVAQEAMSSFEAGPAGAGVSGQDRAIWLLFETLEECAKGASELGDASRGLKLIETIADFSRQALEASQSPNEVGRYFYARCLIRCGSAALGLGAQVVAEGCFKDLFASLVEFKGQDLIDLLQFAAETAGQLEGGQRYRLAGQVLGAARRPQESSEMFERFEVDLTRRIAGDMVEGESAFSAALKRWKGREERSIRDRVALERPSQEGRA